ASGFGMVSVTTKSAETLAGALVSSDSNVTQLRLADGTLQKIPASDIALKTDPVSVMPPMGSILTKGELRDVVAYLASLRDKPSKSQTLPVKARKRS
ncbi:MAG: hypothetical protein ACOYMN_25645, partial [Roseimicrobium sp.]